MPPAMLAWYDREEMETLWAPWRIGYVTAEKPSGCIFCLRPAEREDRQNLILFRGTFCFVVLNLYPYNNGHLMVVPYDHLSSVEDLPAETGAELMALTQRSVGVLRSALHPAAFNIGINQGVVAGAGIADHIHMHVVPRWLGDTNFMPVLAETRVMPQSLENCYDLLAAQFARE